MIIFSPYLTRHRFLLSVSLLFHFYGSLFIKKIYEVTNKIKNCEEKEWFIAERRKVFFYLLDTALNVFADQNAELLLHLNESKINFSNFQANDFIKLIINIRAFKHKINKKKS